MLNQTPEQLREQMVREWGLSAYTPEQQDEFIDRVGTLLYRSILLRAEPLLNEEDKVALDQMGEQGADAAQVLDFLRAHLADFDTIVQEETTSLKSIVAPAA